MISQIVFLFRFLCNIKNYRDLEFYNNLPVKLIFIYCTQPSRRKYFCVEQNKLSAATKRIRQIKKRLCLILSNKILCLKWNPDLDAAMYFLMIFRNRCYNWWTEKWLVHFSSEKLSLSLTKVSICSSANTILIDFPI